MVWPEGGRDVDPANGRFHYVWSVQLDSIDSGEWVTEVDATGKSRSIGILDGSWDRVVRLVLEPTIAGRTPVEVRVNRMAGMSVRKCWQVDVPANGGPNEEVVKQLLTIQFRVGEATGHLYAIILPDGRLVLQDSPHV